MIESNFFEKLEYSKVLYKLIELINKKLISIEIINKSVNDLIQLYKPNFRNYNKKEHSIMLQNKIKEYLIFLY